MKTASVTGAAQPLRVVVYDGIEYLEAEPDASVPLVVPAASVNAVNTTTIHVVHPISPTCSPYCVITLDFATTAGAATADFRLGRHDGTGITAPVTAVVMDAAGDAAAGAEARLLDDSGVDVDGTRARQLQEQQASASPSSAPRVRGSRVAVTFKNFDGALATACPPAVIASGDCAVFTILRVPPNTTLDATVALRT